MVNGSWLCCLYPYLLTELGMHYFILETDWKYGE